MAAQTGTPTLVEQRREAAVAALAAATEADPTFTRAYQQIARIQAARGKLAEAVAALEAARRATPDDANTISMLAQYLTGARPDGTAPTAAELAEAKALAESVGGDDPSGTGSLALAVGFHRAGRSDLAEPWAEKAAAAMDDPGVALVYGDVLLSRAESMTDASEARTYFEAAVAQYDRALERDANLIEAVNNKAWILHRYLGKDREALALIESFARRVERRTLPGEFFDTMGAIQRPSARPTTPSSPSPRASARPPSTRS